MDTAINYKFLLSSFAAIFALVNPVQKIFVMTSLQEQLSDKQLNYLALKSSVTALFILLLFLSLGNIVFNYVFHIKFYAFRITCGLVLLYHGFIALLKGVMIRFDKDVRVDDLSAVPLAMPMIAGPGTITAAVTFPVQYGTITTILAIFFALAINYVIMYYSKSIGKVLFKLNLMTSLIRILGLIIAAIGLQMTLDGIAEFLKINLTGIINQAAAGL